DRSDCPERRRRGPARGSGRGRSSSLAGRRRWRRRCAARGRGPDKGRAPLRIGSETREAGGAWMIVAAAPTAVIIFGQNVSLVEGELPRTPPASLKLDSDLPGSPDPG